MGCLCCKRMGFLRWPVEIHHLNLGGKAGQKRLGDEYTIPLCRWHHQADSGRMSATEATKMLGPTLKDSRAFRRIYGSDEKLLAEANAWLEKQWEQVV